VRRALVTLPDGVWRIIDELKGRIGEHDSEIIRNIIIAHLSDKGILIPAYNVRGIPSSQIQEEMKVQQQILASLAELLDEKNLVKRYELEKRIKQKIQGENYAKAGRVR
jgi:hypothetical protein